MIFLPTIGQRIGKKGSNMLIRGYSELLDYDSATWDGSRAMSPCVGGGQIEKFGAIFSAANLLT